MNYRGRRNAYLNCEKRMFSGVGQFDFPMMEPVDIDTRGVELVGFNYAKTCKNPQDKILHFYVDDYQFERVWNDPDRYIPMLSKFKAVLAPDFSLYDDFPVMVNMFNHYRKQWCAAYWQEHGICVIPTICWALPDSYEWCFEGVPKHSLISISTVGGFGNHQDNKASWLDGYYKCLEVLEPSEILLFGKQYPEIKFDGPMVIAPNAQLEKKKSLSSRSVDKDGFKLPVFDKKLLDK